MVPSLDLPFWPDWEAEGFGIPSVKGGPLQSFFRRWDFGNANIPLGSFGPSMGTPYSAAYPRPLYSAAVGGPNGWVAFGPGAVPDAALTLRIRSSNAALEYLYREGLWGARKDADRVWEEPFRLFWAHDAWDAYLRLFQSFPPAPSSSPLTKKAIGTVGETSGSSTSDYVNSPTRLRMMSAQRSLCSTRVGKPKIAVASRIFPTTLAL